MDAERFEALTAAYGADPRRWPLAEQAAADAFRAADKARAERILFEARLVDAALDASPTPQVSQALREAVLASAPKPRPARQSSVSRPFFDFSRWAMAGAALACALVVGVMAGAGAVQRVTADAQADALIADVDNNVALDEQEFLG